MQNSVGFVNIKNEQPKKNMRKIFQLQENQKKKKS